MGHIEAAILMSLPYCKHRRFIEDVSRGQMPFPERLDLQLKLRTLGMIDSTVDPVSLAPSARTQIKPCSSNGVGPTS